MSEKDTPPPPAPAFEPDKDIVVPEIRESGQDREAR